jgi:hypothetical protein
MKHGIYAVQRAPHVLRVQDRAFDKFRGESGWRRLQIQDPDDIVLAAKGCHKVLSDKSVSACDQNAATVGRRGFDAMSQENVFHVRGSYRVESPLR